MKPDMLFLACTRPAMKIGIPLEAFLLNVIGTALVVIWTHSPINAVIFPAFYLPLKVIASRDHNLFRIGRLWLQTKGPILRPFPVKPPSSDQGITGSV